MKSMFALVRKRISYANVAATLAVLFAMTGGALAASKYIITSTKQIKPSVLAQIKGKNGAPGKGGAPGVQGPQGPAGPAGAQGAKGDNGSNGSNGSNGTEGKAGKDGVTGSKGTTGASGVTGPTGQTGFTEVLPSGKTERGTWSASVRVVPKEEETWTPISFPMRLEKSSPEAFFINATETEELDEGIKTEGKGGCAGTLEIPTAPKGKLCVYTEEEDLSEAELVNVIGRAELGAGYQPSGAFIDFRVKEGGTVKTRGNWAVTAP